MQVTVITNKLEAEKLYSYQEVRNQGGVYKPNPNSKTEDRVVLISDLGFWTLFPCGKMTCLTNPIGGGWGDILYRKLADKFEVKISY